MCSLVFMQVLNNWSRGYPRSCCLRVGYVLLAGLPCLASVGEDCLASERCEMPGWEGIPKGPTGSERGEGMGKGLWEGVIRRVESRM